MPFLELQPSPPSSSSSRPLPRARRAQLEVYLRCAPRLGRLADVGCRGYLAHRRRAPSAFRHAPGEVRRACEVKIEWGGKVGHVRSEKALSRKTYYKGQHTRAFGGQDLDTVATVAARERKAVSAQRPPATRTAAQHPYGK